MTRIENIDSLLSSEDVNGSIIDIDNFIGKVCKYGDQMENLTEQQKIFYLNQNLEREVNNGGFNQYFINSSGEYANETISSLKVIGADKTAGILQKAIEQFPDNNVPKGKDEREEVVEQIESTANEAWEELDNKFMEYEDDLNALNIAYVRNNKNSF